MKLIAAALMLLALPAAAGNSASFSVGARVIHSATVSAHVGAGAVGFTSQGAQPARIQVASNSLGNTVVTLLY